MLATLMVKAGSAKLNVWD